MHLRFEMPYMHRRILKEDPVKFVETFEMDLKERSEDDMPVVASIGDKPWRAATDGTMFVRLTDSDGRSILTHFKNEVARNGSPFFEPVMADPASPALKPELPKRSTSNGREHVVATIAAMERDIVLVGGEAYRLAPEPGLKLSADENGRRAGAGKCLVTTSPDRPDLGIVHAAELRAYLTSSDGLEAGRFPVLETYVPEAFRIDGFDAFMIDEATRYLEMADYVVTRYDEDGMAAYADLRDALRDARRWSGNGPTMESMGKVVEALSNFVPHASEGSMNGIGSLLAWCSRQVPELMPESKDDDSISDWGLVFG
jgi:hypothetical protein